MKKINFKAWDETRNIMCDVVALDWDNDGNIISAHLKQEDGHVYKVYPNDDYGDKIVFLEYIYLNDRNGKEIYNKDIVRVEDYIAVIEWDKETCRFVINIISENLVYDFDNFYGKELEVIGNICERKDLLEKSM